MRPCIRIYYSNFSYCSTCFERHTAHHQELKNIICNLWFTYICGCRLLSTDGNHRLCKTEAANIVFELLMMSGVSLETCWAIRTFFYKPCYRPGCGPEGDRGIALLFQDLGPRRGWVVSVTPRPHFTPGKDPVSILQKAGWAPGPVWTGAENLAPTGIQSPDRPSRSQSLYRLSYNKKHWNNKFEYMVAFYWLFLNNLTCRLSRLRRNYFQVREENKTSPLK